MDKIKNFSCGMTGKGAVWYAYTTANGAKVASGQGGPAHADSFASALAAAGIGGDSQAGDDLAPIVAAQAAKIAALESQAVADAVRYGAHLAELQAQLSSLQGAALAVAADLPMRADPAGDRAVTMLRAAKGGATVTPIASAKRKAVAAPQAPVACDDPVGAHLAALAAGSAPASEVSNG